MKGKALTNRKKKYKKGCNHMAILKDPYWRN